MRKCPPALRIETGAYRIGGTQGKSAEPGSVLFSRPRIERYALFVYAALDGGVRKAVVRRNVETVGEGQFVEVVANAAAFKVGKIAEEGKVNVGIGPAPHRGRWSRRVLLP